MRPKILRASLLILTLLFVLVACGGDDEEQQVPTLAPTAIVPETAESPTQPTPTTQAISQQQPTPTAVPAVETADIDWNPQVVYSSPALGEEALLDGAITIRFDQPMDKETVEKAFTVIPTNNQQQAVQGTFSWPRPDTLVFTPKNQLQRLQNYQVNINQTAMGMNGRSLETAVDVQLQTVGYLEVSQVIPSDDVRDVQTDSAITVLFNRPVVPLVTTNQQASSLPQPLTITPAVAGTGEWVSTSIYRFVPDEPLAGATTYQLTIADGLEDITGGVLADSFTWSFTTLNPSVVSIQPENGSATIPLTQPITVTFNMPMNQASTEAAISLRSTNGTTADFSTTWSDGGRVATLIPQGRLELGTDYQVVVGQSAQSASGQATLDQETVSEFQTVPLPAIAGTTPVNGAVAERYQRGVDIQFSAPMDYATLDGRIIIEPAPDADDIQYYYTEGAFNIYLDFELLRNTEYRITVPGDATDPYGNALGRDYTFSFITPDYDPIASFNLPSGVSQLSTSFVSQVSIINRNVGQFNVNLYDLGLPTSLISRPYETYNYTPSAAPLRSWQINPGTARGETGVYDLALADGGTLPTGVYLLSLDSLEIPADFQYWQNQKNLLIVADTNVVIKEMFDEVHVWVTDINAGRQAAGLNLALYDENGVQVGTAVSDENGFATFSYTNPQGYLSGVTVVSNQPGQLGFGVGSSLWSGGVNPWEMGLNIGYGDEPELFTYLYTDRPIYRPGDTVYFKGLVRQADYGRYNPAPVDAVQVALTPLFYSETGSFEENFNLNVDQNGTFTGEYVLPEDITLGSYQFYVTGQDYAAARSFTVAEYRKPEFLINMAASQPEALRGESVEVVLEAEFFFGGPVSDVPVNWTIYEDTFYPQIEGPYYSFWDGAGFFYHDFGFFGPPIPSPFGNYVTGGSGQTDENGRFVITLPANLLDDVEAGGRKITVEASVSDLSNLPVTSRTTILFHPAESYVGIAAADYVAQVGLSADFNLITTNWAGDAVPNQDVEVVFYQREWQYERKNQYGLYYTDWTPIDTEVGRTQTTTDAQGKAIVSLTPEEGGTYLAVATVRDSGGREQTSSTVLWSLDSTYSGWRTDPKERSMELLPDKDSYAPGETARILVQSPFEGPVNAWLTIERGKLIEQRVVRLESSSDVVDVTIPPTFAPNVFVSVTAVKPVDPNNTDYPYADIRLGITELVVSPEQLALTITLTPSQEQFGPGETAVYNVRVTDFQGRGVQSELSLALVDLAVLTLKPDNAPDIVEAFYARQPYRSQVGGSLFASGEGLAIEIPLEGGGMGGGGGDGLSESALSRAVGDDEDVRRDFPDTAYWQAIIQTDANGQATVEIPLPDSLTTWRLSSKAFTADNLVGQSSTDVVVTLPLLIRPVTPRFFTVGDQIDLGAIVNNNTSQDIEAVVTLIADGVTLHDQAGQTVTVPANGRTLVQWNVLVDDVEFADLTFRVNGGGFTDATKPTLATGPNNTVPVYRYDAEDIVGTSGVLDEAGRQVEAILLPPGVDEREGFVAINLSPSLAAALLDALEYTNDQYYDPACAHSVANVLLPNVATRRAIDQLNLDEPALAASLDASIVQHITLIEGLAFPQGGWSWCYGEIDPWLTGYILLTLDKAQESGFDVDSAVRSEAIAYLQAAMKPAAQLTNAWEVNRQAFFVYVLAENGQDVTQQSNDLFDEHRALLEPYAKALLALSYHLNNNQGSNLQALLADLNDSVVLSATGAHWENATNDWNNLSTDIRSTAMVVSALAQIAPDTVYIPQAVRWLMAARTANHWYTLHETAWSILGLTDWMVATGELDAAFEYAVQVNTEAVTDGSFSQANIMENELVAVPVNGLALEDVNFVGIERGSGNGRLYYTIHLDSFLNAELVGATSRGITVQRIYYDAACDPAAEECQPITQIQAGQQVRVEITLIAPNDLVYVVVEDPIPSGAEAIDPNLDTSASGFATGAERANEGYSFGYWRWWFFNHIQFRDEKVVFTANFLPNGTYQYTYYLQANIPGEFQVMPAIAKEEFFPEVFGRSDGMLFTIVP